MADLLYELRDGIGLLTLNRPERLNAISFEMLEALARTLADADRDPAVRAMKRLYRHGLTEDFSSHSHHVLMQLMLLFRSQDFQEGMQAFVERRPPRFTGR